jgi:hypothetical protein
MPSSCSSRRSVGSMHGACQATAKRRAAGALLASALLPPLGKADLELFPQHERGHPTNQQKHVLHCLGHDRNLPSRRCGVIVCVGPLPSARDYCKLRLIPTTRQIGTERRQRQGSPRPRTRVGVGRRIYASWSDRGSCVSHKTNVGETERTSEATDSAPRTCVTRLFRCRRARP